MAPVDEENKGQKAHDDANPFVAFRRFADDQMSTLMNGVFSISSLFASPSASSRPSVQDYEKWLQEARESSQRLTREAEEAGRIMDVYTRAHKEGQHAVQGDTQAPTSDDDSEIMRCPWPEKPDLDIGPMDDAARSRLSLGALCVCLPNTVLATPVLGEQLPSVPVGYLLYSPYSPVRLEQQPRLCDHGAKWREAFEDLLAVQNGQELSPERSQRMPESGFDWVKGMIHLAMHNVNRENTEESSYAPSKTLEAMKERLGMPSDNETTELAMYDRLFGLQQPSLNGTARAAARSIADVQQDSFPSDTDSKAPSILSTLTTTERTTLQDGSVHTKVVLKNRFSDGREESTETVHHQNAVRQTRDAVPKSIKDEKARTTGKDKEAKEKESSGWFWS